MSGSIDTDQVVSDLATALPLQARDAVATAVAAGTLSGPEGIALADALRDMAAEELDAVEQLAARIATLGGSVQVSPAAVELPTGWKAAVRALLTMHRETLDALVAAIPADADDAEGEATEHLLEHVIAGKRNAMEILERALR